MGVCFYLKDSYILVSQIGFLQAAWRIFGKLCCVHVIQSGVINYQKKNRTNFSLKYQIRLRRGAQVRGGVKNKSLFLYLPTSLLLNATENCLERVNSSFLGGIERG